MVWKQESSGIIPLSSAGQWFQNILQRNHPTLSSLSVGGTFGVQVGSSDCQYEIFLSE